MTSGIVWIIPDIPAACKQKATRFSANMQDFLQNETRNAVSRGIFAFADIHGNNKNRENFLVSFFAFSCGFRLIIEAHSTIIWNERCISALARILTESMQIRKEYAHLRPETGDPNEGGY